MKKEASKNLKILKLYFSAGKNIDAEPLVVETSNITILVGPNNSGKSTALKNIESLSKGEAVSNSVVKDVDISFPKDQKSLEELLRRFECEPSTGQTLSNNEIFVSQPNLNDKQPNSNRIHMDIINQLERDPKLAKKLIAPFYVLRLDTGTRLSLIEPRPGGNLQSSPKNHYIDLLQNPHKRSKLRQITKKLFDLYFIMDPLDMNTINLRMSKVPPKNDTIEGELCSTANQELQKNAIPITDMGDGIKASVGLLAGLVSLPHPIILVDEPDSSLISPVAKSLGIELAKIAKERDASLIITTHSAEFIMGCVGEAPENTNIIRLTYEKDKATARNLKSQEISKIFTDPILGNSGIIQGLFHKSVIITEGDSDRITYEVINNRMITAGKGIKDTLFLNKDGKDSLHKIIKPLRELGIPTAVIVDLDFLNSQENKIKLLTNACQIPYGDFHENLKHLNDTLKDKKIYKNGGIYKLENSEKEKAEKLLKDLAEYGLFIVPYGELEDWEEDGDKNKKGESWVEHFFKLSPLKHQRIKDFLNSISEWVENPNRKGIN